MNRNRKKLPNYYDGRYFTNYDGRSHYDKKGYYDGRSYYNPNAFNKRTKRGNFKYKFVKVCIIFKTLWGVASRIVMFAIGAPVAAIAIVATVSCIWLKITGDIKFNSTEGQNKVLKYQRDQFLLTENPDGSKSTNIAEALRLHLETLNIQLEKDFSKAGSIHLYTDRMYDVPKNAKKEDIKVPTYEECPDLYLKAMYQYPTKFKGTIDLSTHILPAFNYSFDPKFCERAIVGTSLYINIPDTAIFAEGFVDERGGSEATDSFGATLSQIFNKKDEEESKAYEGLDSAIKAELAEAAKQRLLDPEVMVDIRKAAVEQLYEILALGNVDTSHLIIKANGAQLSEELAIINEQNAKNANK